MPPGSRATALTRPSDHGGRTCTSCPRRRSSSSVAVARAVLDLDLVEVQLARIERARHVVGVEARGVDRGLQVAAEVQVAEQRAERPLVLHVAARRADRHVGLAAAQHERRRERRARPLARLERVRQPLGEPEHLRARAEAEAEAGDDRGAVQPAAARGRRDEVAVAVGDVEVAGVARQAERRLAGAGGARDRGGDRRHPRLAPVRRARAQLLRRALADQRAALVRVRRAQQRRRAGRPRTPGRRTTPRGPRRPASRTRRRCGRSPARGPSPRGRSPRAARAAGASPAPAPTARSCRSCGRGSRASPAPRASPASPRGRRRSAARGGARRSRPSPRPRASSRRSPRPPSRGRTRRARRRCGPRACSPRGCSRPRSGS